MKACTRTVCKMVSEQHVRYETRTRCYKVPQECVQQVPYTTCKLVPGAPRPHRDPHPLLHGAGAHVRYVPYTTCRMVPETHCKMVTQQQCYTVPEVKTCQIPYTTCRMVTEQHVRYVVKRHCTMVPETVTRQVCYTTCRMVKEDHVRYETRCVVEKVPEVCVRQVPVTTCRMVPETCQQVVRQCRVNYVCEERVQCVPVTTCKVIPETHCRMVPHQTCHMEPYTVHHLREAVRAGVRARLSVSVGASVSCEEQAEDQNREWLWSSAFPAHPDTRHGCISRSDRGSYHDGCDKPSERPRTMPPTLRVGAVNYLNTKPLIERLTDFAPNIDLSLDLPSRLADQLAAGELDVGPDPGRRVLPRRQLHVRPGHRHRLPRAGAERHAVQPGAVGRDSHASRSTKARAPAPRSTQILLRKRYGVTPARSSRCRSTPPPTTLDTDAVLLIGDRAMRACLPGYRFAYDLGEEWTDWTGLPLVFAVWAVRAGRRPGRRGSGLPPRRRSTGWRAPARSPSARRRAWASTPASAAATSSNIIRFDLGRRELAGLRGSATCADWSWASVARLRACASGGARLGSLCRPLSHA